jgi:hypothetical protein
VDAETTGGGLVDLRILEHRVDALASTAVEDATGLRRSVLQRHAVESERPLALRGCHAKRPVRVRQRDQHDARVHELPKPACDQREQWLELELRRERVADLAERFQLSQPAGRGLVQARVLDRHRGLCSEKLRQLLVLVAEIEPALLLGQVQVAVGHAP